MNDPIETGRAAASKACDAIFSDGEDKEKALSAINETEPPSSLGGDNRAQAAGGGAMKVVGLVVALTVGAIIAAFLLPIGIQELTSATLGTEASEGANALWGILDVIIVLAVFLFFISIALKSADKV